MSAEGKDTGSESNTVGERDADFSAFESNDDSSEQDSSKTSNAEIGTMQSEISRLRTEVAEQKDLYLRALADLENFRRRAQKERSELLKYQGEQIVTDLLEVLDNLDWALVHSDTEPEKLRPGLELIQKLFVDVLGKWEIRGQSAVGKDFDPVQHQALSRMVVDGTPAGKVVNEFKKAYYYKDKLLRPANVVVSAEKSAEPEEACATEESDSKSE